jgi:hypothetical protein
MLEKLILRQWDRKISEKGAAERRFRALRRKRAIAHRSGIDLRERKALQLRGGRG